MSILAKYPHNTPVTCHFSIKKKSKNKKTKTFIFIFYFFKKMGVWGGVISQS
jgi:hypothetical protein